LKHTPQRFTVEVRRHRGRPTFSKAQSAERETLTPAPGAGPRDADEKSSPETHQTLQRGAEKTRPSGRILPSLAESGPEIVVPPQVESSRRPARGASAESKPKPRARLVSTDIASVDRQAPQPNAADADLGTDSGVVSRQSQEARPNDNSPATAPSQTKMTAKTERSAAKSAAAAKPRRRSRRTRADAAPQTNHALVDVETSSIPDADALPAPPTNLDGGASRERRRSIIARYVFGTELKLGERWKQRLRRRRR
jgi:hypothetical protein